MKFVNANKLHRKSRVWGTRQLWQMGSGTLRAVIPLKPKNGLNGHPAFVASSAKARGAVGFPKKMSAKSAISAISPLVGG